MSALARKRLLESWYAKWNRRAFVHPDPLETLYPFRRRADREIVGLIAAGLAFGGVRAILNSIATVTARLEPHPSTALRALSRRELLSMFAAFRHRWVDGEHLASFLWAIRETVRTYGSLEKAYTDDAVPVPNTPFPLLHRFVDRVCACGSTTPGPLLSDPAAGSACKRLHLYLRWMVRKDAVDPGGWSRVSPASLYVPLDTHMHRMALDLGLTRRKQANAKTVCEVTEAFGRIRPDDPVRYDFVLTRFGIRRARERDAFIRQFRGDA